MSCVRMLLSTSSCWLYLLMDFSGNHCRMILVRIQLLSPYYYYYQGALESHVSIETQLLENVRVQRAQLGTCFLVRYWNPPSKPCCIWGILEWRVRRQQISDIIQGALMFSPASHTLPTPSTYNLHLRPDIFSAEKPENYFACSESYKVLHLGVSSAHHASFNFQRCQNYWYRGQILT